MKKITIYHSALFFLLVFLIIALSFLVLSMEVFPGILNGGCMPLPAFSSIEKNILPAVFASFLPSLLICLLCLVILKNRDKQAAAIQQAHKNTILLQKAVLWCYHRLLEKGEKHLYHIGNSLSESEKHRNLGSELLTLREKQEQGRSSLYSMLEAHQEIQSFLFIPLFRKILMVCTVSAYKRNIILQNELPEENLIACGNSFLCATILEEVLLEHIRIMDDGKRLHISVRKSTNDSIDTLITTTKAEKGFYRNPVVPEILEISGIHIQWMNEKETKTERVQRIRIPSCSEQIAGNGT